MDRLPNHPPQRLLIRLAELAERLRQHGFLDGHDDRLEYRRLEQAGGLPVLDHRLPEGQRCPNLTRNRRQDHIGLLLVVALSADDDGRPTLAA